MKPVWTFDSNDENKMLDNKIASNYLHRYKNCWKLFFASSETTCFPFFTNYEFSHDLRPFYRSVEIGSEYASRRNTNRRGNVQFSRRGINEKLDGETREGKALEDSSCKFDRATISPRSKQMSPCYAFPLVYVTGLSPCPAWSSAHVCSRHTGQTFPKTFISRRKLFPISFIYFPLRYLSLSLSFFFHFFPYILELEVKSKTASENLIMKWLNLISSIIPVESVKEEIWKIPTWVKQSL